MGAMSRRKGAGWEREVAGLLKPLFPRARRGIGQARDGSDVPDVDGTPYWIEAKSRKRCNVQAALEQADVAQHEHCSPGGPPRPVMAACKDTGGRPLVAMYLGDFLELLRAAHRAPPAPGPAEGPPLPEPGASPKERACAALDALRRAVDEWPG